jgi:hypothetical protein
MIPRPASQPLLTPISGNKIKSIASSRIRRLSFFLPLTVFISAEPPFDSIANRFLNQAEPALYA